MLEGEKVHANEMGLEQGLSLPLALPPDSQPILYLGWFARVLFHDTLNDTLSTIY